MQATMTREEVQREALTRAVSGQTLSNWPAIIAGFTAKGIPEADILPRENVFTYNAWRALGRQVRRDEHGVKCITFIPVRDKGDKADVESATGMDGKIKGRPRPWTATVFHVSQTDPVN